MAEYKTDGNVSKITATSGDYSVVCELLCCRPKLIPLQSPYKAISDMSDLVRVS